MPGVEAEHRRVGAMLLRVVQLAAAVEHAARPDDVAGELEADAEQVMGGHQERRVAGPLRLRHQLVGPRAILPQVAPDRVEQRDRPEDGEQLRRVAELVAQLAGAREDRLDLRTGPALHHAQRQAANHLQPELVLHALGAIRQAAQHAQPAVGERERLGEREQPHGVPRPLEEVLRARAEIACRLEQRAEPAGDRRVLAA